MAQVFSLEVDGISAIKGAGIPSLIDWPKSELSAYIFGGNEPPGRLFTTSHEFVIIDSEQMFSTGPSPFEGSPWLRRPDGTEFPGGKELATEVCAEVASLPDSFLVEALNKPRGLSINLSWPIEPKLLESKIFATSYLRLSAGA